MKEFKISEATEKVEFKIGDDVFTAVPANRLPAGALIRYVELVNDGKLFAAHKIFFADVLDDESAGKFESRLDSRDNPIPLSTLVDIAAWLIDLYSSVPTVPAKS